MNVEQRVFDGGRRGRVVLLVAAGAVLTVGVSGLFADGPDYNNPKLRKGGFVPSDSTTTQTQEGWWNKRWKPATSDTNVAPCPAALNAKALLDKNSPEPWGGSWNPETGLSAGLWGRTFKSYAGTPGQIAVAFLADYRPLITGLEPAADPGHITFQTARMTERKEYTVVHVQEVYKGVPVYGGGPVVHMDKAGHVTKVMGSCRPIGDIDITPALDSAAACEALKRAILPDSVCPFEQVPWRAITPDSAHLPNPVHLVVWPGSLPRLLYDVYAQVWVDGYHRPFQFFLDANTGELLETRQMWREKGKPRATPTERLDRGGPAGGYPVDSSASKLRPYYRNAPIRRVPQGEWDAIKGQRQRGADSVKVPYDTTRPNPRPYRPSAEVRGRKEEARARFQAAKGLTAPASWAWFYCATYIPDIDLDGDGYDAHAIIEWDADTYAGSWVKIYVKVYGRDAWEIRDGL